jgi:hypothetical protein
MAYCDAWTPPYADLEIRDGTVLFDSRADAPPWKTIWIAKRSRSARRRHGVSQRNSATLRKQTLYHAQSCPTVL